MTTSRYNLEEIAAYLGVSATAPPTDFLLRCRGKWARMSKTHDARCSFVNLTEVGIIRLRCLRGKPRLLELSLQLLEIDPGVDSTKPLYIDRDARHYAMFYQYDHTLFFRLKLYNPFEDTNLRIVLDVKTGMP